MSAEQTGLTAESGEATRRDELDGDTVDSGRTTGTTTATALAGALPGSSSEADGRSHMQRDGVRITAPPGMSTAAALTATVAPLVDDPPLETDRDPGLPLKPPRWRSTSPTATPERGVRPLTRKERKVMGRMRARKVRRVVRHIDPWSMLKLSLIFYFCLFLIVMVAGVILWNIASHAGTIDDLQSLFKDLGLFETFTFKGDVIFQGAAIIGLILVITGTGLNVLLAVLFNLISDLVGGIRVTVIEEETAQPVVRAERKPGRR